MAPRRRCPTCGSRQWHKEPSSGLIVCSEGHILQNYRNETTEITETGPHALKKRTLKSKRKDGGPRSRANPKLYHGARGRYHYFLCLQLILRRQIQTLIRLWDLPAEFEVVCRDTWALHLSLLPDPPPAEPFHHAQENLAGPAPAKAKSPLNPTKAKDEPSPSVARNDSDAENEGENADGSEEEAEGYSKRTIKDEPEENEDEGEDEEDEDPELDALMQENSDLSSSSDEDGAKPSPSRKKLRRKANGHSPYESVASTVAVLVIGCWMLRIPVMIRDFTRLIESYELPYLDPVLHILPPSMVQHLTKGSIQALSPPHAPSTMLVSSIASRLSKKLFQTYGVQVPEYNAASILWRLTKEMGGTPVLYRLAKRVASVLSVPLTLHAVLAPGAGRHQYDNAPPEVSLLACILIVLKMVYGLDGQERGPKDADDVACALPRAKEYLDAIEKMQEEDLQQKEVKFSSRRLLRVGDMDEEEMDEYIQFCEKALIGPGTEDEPGLERYFPAPSTERSERAAVEDERSRRNYRGTEATDEGLRPGAEYKIWNARDVDGTVPDAYGRVVGRCAFVVGVGAEAVGEVVGKYERRLNHWIALKHRRARDEDR